MGYFVDYISFTLHIDTEIPGVALAYFYKIVDLEIEEGKICKGLDYYKQSVMFPSGVRILFDGSPGMGIHVIIPGLGLISEHMDFDLFRFIETLRATKLKYNISRIDIALDSNEVDFSYFYNKMVRKLYLCKYTAENIRKNVDANNRGTLYFGKRGGLTMFRIYDKALKQGVEGIWTRVELECRNDACEQIIEAMRAGTVNQYFLGHLKFIDKKVSNVARAMVSKRYLQLLENPPAQMKLHKKESDSTLEWFITQVAPTVKALERDYGAEFVRRMVDGAKISKKQLKERFNMQVINSSEIVNTKTGVIEDSNVFKPELGSTSKEYVQFWLAEIEKAV